ncbi:MAG: hypothetical protein M0R40_06235 [Firmicutes bacterium]|nr:hypothetical protein [Bacillota bacterium]
MSINFSENQWDKIKRDYTLWWKRELERPLVPVVLKGLDPGIAKPSTPLLSQATCHDLSVPAKDIIERIDYELSQNLYLGDAFPYFNMDCFGPGIAAAFLGADLNNATGNVWFHPKEIKPLNEIYFEYNPDNVWLIRIKEICYEGMKRWQGQVQMGMPDLSGMLDILSVFAQGDKLLLALYDEPGEVKRLVWEIQKFWFRFYDEINEVLQPINPGYSDWSQIYSPTPSYVLQCDFAYMISAEMFEEFALPEIKSSCKKLSHTLYHLDGIGNLPNLDSILKIKELDAVQWVPGEGQPPQSKWPEVYRKIAAAGKNIQIREGFDLLEAVSNQIGTLKGIHQKPLWGTVNQKNDMLGRLAKIGVI